MISLHEANESEHHELQPHSASIDLSKELGSAVTGKVYPMVLEMIEGNTMALASLSDSSMVLLDVEKLKPIVHVPGAHNKRINGLWIGEDNCYSCSNDGFVKIWDLKEKDPLVKKFKAKGNDELYSISQAKHILGSGSGGNIYFWDLRNGSALTNFDQTHPDDVTSLEFFKPKPSLLLSASVDGMVCLFDLKQENEEDSAESVLVAEQPVNTCRFFEGDYSAAFALTTTSSIIIMSLEEARVIKQLDTIEHVDTNEYTLIDAHARAGDGYLYYLRGNLRGTVEEYSVSLLEDQGAVLLNKFLTGHKGPITATKKLNNEYILSSGEDGTFQITQKIAPPSNLDFKAIEKSMFIEDEGSEDSLFNMNMKKKRKNFTEFVPY
jgi:WD40 repeat protein